MDIGIVSARYARALLMYATEKNETETVYRCMSILGESFEKVPTLRATFENPVIGDEKKFELLNIASGNADCESLNMFFKLVLKNRRISMVQFMAHSYINFYRKENRLIHSRLIVPVEVTENTIGRLKNLVKENTQDEVEFDIEIDPSIIGGFIMEYDTYSYDASIRSKLKAIKKELLRN